MFYLIVIAAANVLIVLCNALASRAGSLNEWLWYLLCSVAATAFVFALDALGAVLIRRLPERWFAPGKRSFEVSERERRLWRKLGVKRWTPLVPEWGGFTDFHKDRLASSTDAAYLARFLLESNYGVVIHLENALLGFLILLLPLSRHPGVGVPVAAVNFVLSFLPVVILRYNTPPLLRLWRRSQAKEDEKEKNPPPSTPSAPAAPRPPTRQT